MPPTLLPLGKRQPPVATATATGNKGSRLAFILDLSSSRRFLIHPGAEVNFLKPNPTQRFACKSGPHLSAANGSSIGTYGQASATFDLGLHRKFRWLFTVADVSCNIIGADLLAFFKTQLAHPEPDADLHIMVDASDYAGICKQRSQDLATIRLPFNGAEASRD